VEASWSVLRAAQLLNEHGFSNLPVVDEEDRLVGLVSPDIAAAVASGCGAPRHSSVREIMITNPTTIPVDAHLHEAVAILATNRVTSLPVVSGTDLVGIITRCDVIRAFYELFGLGETGAILEVALPNGCADVVNAFGALTEDDQILSALVSTTRRHDGREPALCLRLRGRSARPVAARLNAALSILLQPEDPNCCQTDLQTRDMRVRRWKPWMSLKPKAVSSSRKQDPSLAGSAGE
jgi:CBS domain-containing protein